MFYMAHFLIQLLQTSKFGQRSSTILRLYTEIACEDVEGRSHKYSMDSGAKNRKLCRISSKRKKKKKIGNTPILNIFEILSQTAFIEKDQDDDQNQVLFVSILQ